MEFSNGLVRILSAIWVQQQEKKIKFRSLQPLPNHEPDEEFQESQPVSRVFLNWLIMKKGIFFFVSSVFFLSLCKIVVDF